MIPRKQTIKPVSSLVSQVLKGPLFSTASMDSKIRDHWTQVLGKGLAPKIEFVGFQNNRILVSSNSAASKNELVFRQSEFLELFRALIAPTEVTEFKFF